MGDKTLNEYFYKPALGASGAVEKGKFDAALDVADAEIKANKEAKRTGLIIDVKEENTSNITKGQPVYVSGSVGAAFPKVGLAKSNDTDKYEVIGLAAEDITKNQRGSVRTNGLLEGVDSLGATDINPDNETWVPAELLYLHTTTGGLTKTEPTEGRVIEVGYSLYGSSNTDVILLMIHAPHIHMEVDSGEDIVLRMGDSAGVNKTIFKGYDNIQVAEVDSNGNATFTNTLVDVVTTFSSVDTLTVAEAGLILVSAGSPYTLTLPTASGNTGLTYKFVKTDYNYNLITLEGNGAETFNYENSTGSPNLTYPRLNTPLAEVTIVSDGSNWQVINEAMGQVPRARVYLGTTQANLTSGAYTLVELDTESFDIGANFNTSTHLFTAPVAGKYKVFGQVRYTQVIVDKKYAALIYQQGVAITHVEVHSAVDVELAAFTTALFSAAIDDTVGLYARHSAGVDTVDVVGNTISTYLIIELISKV